MEKKKINLLNRPKFLIIATITISVLPFLVLCKANHVSGKYKYVHDNVLCQTIDIKTSNVGYFITFENEELGLKYSKYKIAWKIKPLDNSQKQGTQVIDIRWTSEESEHQLILNIGENFSSFYETKTAGMFGEPRVFVR